MTVEHSHKTKPESLSSALKRSEKLNRETRVILKESETQICRAKNAISEAKELTAQFKQVDAELLDSIQKVRKDRRRRRQTSLIKKSPKKKL